MSDDYGYPLVPLHQVARRITDGSHFSPTPREHGPLIANVKDMKAGAIDFSTCTRISPSAYRELKATGCTIKNGNVLLSKDGTVGRVLVYRQDDEIGALSSICIIEPTDRLDAAFLGQALQSEGCTRQYDNFMSGSALRRLVLRDIRSIQVPLPDSEHQRAIAQVLDTLDTAIHETEAIIAKLKAVKQGLLHDLLTRGIAANGELRPPQAEAPQLYKDSPLGWIPKEWALSTVGAQFEIQLGKMLDGQKNTGILKPYVGNKAVQWDRIDLNEVQQVRLSRSDLNRFRLHKGDLLVCEGGDVGRAAIWNDEMDECYYQKALHRLRPLHGYHPRLMLEMLRYLMGRDALSEYVSKTSIAHLTQEKLAAVPLPTPDVDEQQRLVAEVLAAKQRQEAEESQLQKLSLLKAGLMDDLLTGRVRVTPLLEGGAA
ncbi:restriction endonuclease subunit S [Methylocaldum gracile subsp. desertum]|uniref:restriction endonuclease subunit S n=1 Tax=Methylocaldum sp. GT1BW TaxID=3438964 RepID=UPI003DA0AD3B